MKNNIIIATVGLTLAACGGGSGGSLQDGDSIILGDSHSVSLKSDSLDMSYQPEPGRSALAKIDSSSSETALYAYGLENQSNDVPDWRSEGAADSQWVYLPADALQNVRLRLVSSGSSKVDFSLREPSRDLLAMTSGEKLFSGHRVIEKICSAGMDDSKYDSIVQYIINMSDNYQIDTSGFRQNLSLSGDGVLTDKLVVSFESDEQSIDVFYDYNEADGTLLAEGESDVFAQEGRGDCTIKVKYEAKAYL